MSLSDILLDLEDSRCVDETVSRRVLPILAVLACSPPAKDSATSTDQHEAPPKTPAVKPETPPEQPTTSPIARSINAFSFDLYRRLATKPGNMVLSPASVAIALGMTATGARGPTAAEFDAVLRTEVSGLPESRWHTALGKLARDWTAQSTTSDGPEIHVAAANRLFVQEGLRVVAPLMGDLNEYIAPIHRVDFAAPEAARTHINDWVGEQTHDRIRELVPSGGISPTTRLVLANALYFKSDWVNPFPARGTKNAPFHIEANEVVSVPTMHNTAGYQYAKVDGASVVQMHYWRTTFAMVIVVPDAIDGLQGVEVRLSAKTVADWVAALKRERIEVALPKFKLAPSTSLTLRSALQELGLITAFSDDADFGDLVHKSEGPLKISNVFHKGFIEVDEDGTEAAAATAVALKKRSIQLQPAIKVAVDRPFLFLIRDTSTGAVVFVGRVVDPR